MRNSGGCGRVVLFGGLAVFVLIALVTAGVFYVANSVRVSSAHKGDDVSIQFPGGHFDVRAHQNMDPAALGVPIYPDAKRTQNKGSATFEWSSDSDKYGKSLSVAAADYVTTDPPQKVFDWYRERLPDWVTKSDHNGFEFVSGSYKRTISIREKSDGTHIGVAAVGKPASN